MPTYTIKVDDVTYRYLLFLQFQQRFMSPHHMAKHLIWKEVRRYPVDMLRIIEDIEDDQLEAFLMQAAPRGCEQSKA